jgi:hypothetical protein
MTTDEATGPRYERLLAFLHLTSLPEATELNSEAETRPTRQP